LLELGTTTRGGGSQTKRGVSTMTTPMAAASRQEGLDLSEPLLPSQEDVYAKQDSEEGPSSFSDERVALEGNPHEVDRGESPLRWSVVCAKQSVFLDGYGLHSRTTNEFYSQFSSFLTLLSMCCLV
jgi:hypothetical protein